MADSRNALGSRSWLLIASLIGGTLAATVAPHARSAEGPVGPAPATPAAKRGGGYRFNPVERCFMRKIDRRRARHGLHRLSRDKHLGYVARRHALRMARRGAISHDHRLARRLTNWLRLGQNVGQGATCKGLFRAFWRSPRHRENILGRWRFMGVGAHRRGGRLYVHQVFHYRSKPRSIYGFL